MEGADLQFILQDLAAADCMCYDKEKHLSNRGTHTILWAC